MNNKTVENVFLHYLHIFENKLGYLKSNDIIDRSTGSSIYLSQNYFIYTYLNK